MNKHPPIHFAVPVWGEGYVETFLNYCLPAQLAAENVPVLASSSGHCYRIFTTSRDRLRIVESAAFRALQAAITVEVELIDDALSDFKAAGAGAKYSVKGICYKRALQLAKQHDAAVVALNADILLANGFVRSACELLARGKRVIEVVGPRGLHEPITRALLASYARTDGTISIEPVELSALWLENIHPLLEMHFVEGPSGANFHPSHLYWRVGNDGVIARCFHLYPIVIYPKDAPIAFTTTIDDDLAENLQLATNERHVADDSRAMFCCELSPPEQYVGHMAYRGQLDGYVDVYASYGGRNLSNLEKEIIISRTDNLGANWRQRRRESHAFVRGLVRRYHTTRYRRHARRLADQARTALRQLIPASFRPALRRARSAFGAARDCLRRIR